MTAHAIEIDARTLTSVDETTAMRIDTVRDVTAFDTLREEWNALLSDSRADSIFLTWEWLRTWWTHLAGDVRLALLTVRSESELIAIAPFKTTGPGLLGISTLSFLGTGRVGSDYLDIIVRRGHETRAMRALSRHIARTGAIIDMKQARVATSSAAALAKDLRRDGARIQASLTHRCPVIDLTSGSFTDYLASLGAEHRYAFARKLRRLERDHELRFERIETADRLRDALPILFELHRLRWDERGGSDGLAGSSILAFHEAFTRLALERGWLRLYIVWVGGLPAATFYGFRHGSVFSFYQSGFDPAFKKLGVGTVAMGLAIKAAFEEGAREFDFLHGEESYKFHWTKATKRLGSIVSYPGGVAGNAVRLAARAKSLGKSAVRWIRRRGASFTTDSSGGGRASASC